MKEKILNFVYKNNIIFIYEAIKTKTGCKNKKCLATISQENVNFKYIINLYSYELFNENKEIIDMFSKLFPKENFKEQNFQYPVIDNKKLEILNVYSFINNYNENTKESLCDYVWFKKLQRQKLDNITEYLQYEINQTKSLRKTLGLGLYSDIFIDFNKEDIEEVLICSNYLLKLINTRMSVLALLKYQKYTWNAIAFFRYIFNESLNDYLMMDNEELRGIFKEYMNLYDILQSNSYLYSAIAEISFCLINLYGSKDVSNYLKLIQTLLEENKIDKFHKYVLTLYWLKRIFKDKDSSNIILPSLNAFSDNIDDFYYLEGYLESGKHKKYRLFEDCNNILLYDEVKTTSNQYKYENKDYKIETPLTFFELIKDAYQIKYNFSHIWDILDNKECVCCIKDKKNRPLAIITIKNRKIIGFYEYNIMKESIIKDIRRILKEFAISNNLEIVAK